MPNLIVHLGAGVLLTYVLAKRKNEEFNVILIQIFAANLIDIDHILATPMYDPSRCGINFHPLHSWYAVPLYVVGLLSKYKYFFVGIVLHLALDALDCVI